MERDQFVEMMEQMWGSTPEPAAEPDPEPVRFVGYIAKGQSGHLDPRPQSARRMAPSIRTQPPPEVESRHIPQYLVVDSCQVSYDTTCDTKLHGRLGQWQPVSV